MITVIVSKAEPGRLSMPVGRIDFYRVPVQAAKDYFCDPENLLSFADVQAISAALAQNPPVIRSTLGRYDWQAS
jgi:hypothetical protein